MCACLCARASTPHGMGRGARTGPWNTQKKQQQKQQNERTVDVHDVARVRLHAAHDGERAVGHLCVVPHFLHGPLNAAHPAAVAWVVVHRAVWHVEGKCSVSHSCTQKHPHPCACPSHCALRAAHCTLKTSRRSAPEFFRVPTQQHEGEFVGAGNQVPSCRVAREPEQHTSQK